MEKKSSFLWFYPPTRNIEWQHGGCTLSYQSRIRIQQLFTNLGETQIEYSNSSLLCAPHQAFLCFHTKFLCKEFSFNTLYSIYNQRFHITPLMRKCDSENTCAQLSINDGVQGVPETIRNRYTYIRTYMRTRVRPSESTYIA